MPTKKDLLDGTGFNALRRWRHGWILYNPRDMYIGRSIGRYGEFSEREFEAFIQFCGPGDVVLDIGANIGAHTIGLARRVGPQGLVHAFEPQRIIFQTLCANIALNSLTNVHCHQVALGAEDGIAVVPPVDHAEVHNFGGISMQFGGDGEPVPMKQLDDLIDPPSCRFVKMDVEGMEREVLLGAQEILKQHRPILCVENDRQEKSRDLIETLRALDYKLYWFVPWMFNPDNFDSEREDIFPNIASVNMIGVPTEQPARIEGLAPVGDSGEDVREAVARFRRDRDKAPQS